MIWLTRTWLEVREWLEGLRSRRFQMTGDDWRMSRNAARWEAKHRR